MTRKASKLLISTTDTAKELFFIYISLLFTASCLYALFEHKSLFDAFWWSVVTAMTVGYGDTYPVTIGGRIIGILLMHSVVLIIIPLITARLAAKLTVNSDAFTHTEQESIKNDLRDIKKHLNI